MLESLFNKVADVRGVFQHMCFPVKFPVEIFKNTYFEEHLQTAFFNDRFYVPLSENILNRLNL